MNTIQLSAQEYASVLLGRKHLLNMRNEPVPTDKVRLAFGNDYVLTREIEEVEADCRAGERFLNLFFKKTPTWSCFYVDARENESLCVYIDGYDIGEVLVKFYAEEHRHFDHYQLVAVIPGIHEDALGFWSENCVKYSELPEILKYLKYKESRT